jgi:hypothetical protein
MAELFLGAAIGSAMCSKSNFVKGMALTTIDPGLGMAVAMMPDERQHHSCIKHCHDQPSVHTPKSRVSLSLPHIYRMPVEQLEACPVVDNLDNNAPNAYDHIESLRMIKLKSTSHIIEKLVKLPTNEFIDSDIKQTIICTVGVRDYDVTFYKRGTKMIDGVEYTFLYLKVQLPSRDEKKRMSGSEKKKWWAWW